MNKKDGLKLILIILMIGLLAFWAGFGIGYKKAEENGWEIINEEIN